MSAHPGTIITQGKDKCIQNIILSLPFCRWICKAHFTIWKNRSKKKTPLHVHKRELLGLLDALKRIQKGCDQFNQNSNPSDREKWSTSKGGPVFSKLFRLDRTDPLSFGPKFPESLVEWIAPKITQENAFEFIQRISLSTFKQLGNGYLGLSRLNVTNATRDVQKVPVSRVPSAPQQPRHCYATLILPETPIYRLGVRCRDERTFFE